MEKCAEKRWHFTYDRNMSYQRIHPFSFGYRVQLSDFFDVKIESEAYCVKDGHVSVFYEQRDHQEAMRQIRQRFLTGGAAHARKIRKVIEDRYADFISFSEGLPSDYGAAPNARLAEAFEDFYRKNEAISLPTWLLYLYIEEILTDVLRAKLQEKLHGADRADRIMSALAQPTDILPIDAYHAGLYEIALLPPGQQGAALDAFSAQYASWGVYDILYDVPDRVFHEAKIAGLSREEAQMHLSAIREKYEQQRKEVEDLGKYWKGNDELAELAGLFMFYANFKDWKNYYRELNAFKMRFLMLEISRRSEISPETLAFMTETEVLSVLKGDRPVERDLADRRRHDSAIVVLEDKETIVMDAGSLRAIDELLRFGDDIREIPGTVAFRGICTGPVRIIRSPQDGAYVQEGDILVASTTRPDYLPFMKISAGFVTNEGGALSHAAIMARELKKPCIIGTKIATQVLKDGDMVEVDADKGEVRVIERAKAQ